MNQDDKKPGKNVRTNLQSDLESYEEQQENPADGNQLESSLSKAGQGVSLHDEMMSVLERITSFQKKTCESLNGLR